MNRKARAMRKEFVEKTPSSERRMKAIRMM